MKRPYGLWLLLSAGVLCFLRDVQCVRATALIFSKTTTTTTTANPESNGDELSTEISTDIPVANTTAKSNLTGNPQLDYIYDPNLPQELNGYNLSEYPFYERVPEDINFKCDGLHDGFYASVPHKCQVYHHCLFGTRYDFLCANYTAFDQKTFICHFVSEVDCVNSKKYWHRNDALYQAASTTTVKPLIVYTPPSQPSPVLTGGSAATGPAARRPPNRRRPLRRRRPQYDYYDEYEDEYQDYYEERPARTEARRRRVRPRPRPIYEDDYEEYEYERRGASRRPNHRNKDRRQYEDVVEEDVAPRRSNKRRPQKPEEDYPERRRPHEDTDRMRNKPKAHKEEDVPETKRPKDADHEERRNKPKSSTTRRPPEEDYVEDGPAERAAERPIIKPTSGASIYDKPRAAPRIKPPVPKGEAGKYAYKPMGHKETPKEDEEYYEEYEYEEPVKPRKQEEHKGHARRPTKRPAQEEEVPHEEETPNGRRPIVREEVPEVEKPRRPVYKSRYSPANKRPVYPPVQEEYEEYEEEIGAEQSVSKETSSTSTTTTTRKPTTTTTTTVPPSTTSTPRPETIVRIVKRPFLPSRGGNPYSPRGLQPVGTKANNKTTSEEELKQYNAASHIEPEAFKPVSSRPQTPPRITLKIPSSNSGPRTTQKPKLPDPKEVLDENNEFDVTLNDALNPTLPNLPVRSFPIGYTSGNNDYAGYASFQRPRYVAETQPQEYYQKPTAERQRFEAIPFNPQDHLVNSNVEYKGQYSSIAGQFRPRVTQAYYSSYLN